METRISNVFLKDLTGLFAKNPLNGMGNRTEEKNTSMIKGIGNNRQGMVTHTEKGEFAGQD